VGELSGVRVDVVAQRLPVLVPGLGALLVELAALRFELIALLGVVHAHIPSSVLPPVVFAGAAPPAPVRIVLFCPDRASLRWRSASRAADTSSLAMTGVLSLLPAMAARSSAACSFASS